MNTSSLYFNPNAPMEPEDFLLSINDMPCIPTGNLYAVKGAHKSGKSQLGFLIASECLKMNLGFDSDNPNLRAIRPMRVLIFDTEQGKNSLKRCTQRAAATLGHDLSVYEGITADIRFCDLTDKPVTPDDGELSRLQIIERLVEDFRPTLIIIDGIRDLIKNFNDTIESSTLVNRLHRLSLHNSCAILCVIHENKGGSKEMRGHLGTELQNKIHTCFAVEKRYDVFHVSFPFSRGPEIAPFAFELCDEQYDMVNTDKPATHDAPIPYRQQFSATDLIRATIAKIQFPPEGMKRPELCEYVMAAERIGRSLAQMRIKRAIEEGILHFDSFTKLLTPAGL